MSEMKKPLLYVLVLVGGLLFVGDIARAATSAEKSLQKGIEAFRKNDTDKAMDYFVDVLMNGTAAQQARANNYIDAIHNKIGGIETPVEVDLTFPEQPTQTVVDPANNLANYGTERLNTLATQAENAMQETADLFEDGSRSLTEQIEARQLEGYLTEEPVKQPVTQAEPTPTLEPLIQPVPSVQPVQQTTNLIPTQEELDALVQPAAATQTTPVVSTPAASTTTVPAPRLRQMSDPTEAPVAYAEPLVDTTSYVEPAVQTVTYTEPAVDTISYAQPTAQTVAYVVPTTYTEPVQSASGTYTEPVTYTAVPAATTSTLTSSTFADLTSDSAISARNLYTAQKLQSMTEEAEHALKSAPGVHLYLREDGRPDAIDVDDGVLFKGNYFRSDSLDTLNYIYELLALTQGASYTILPSGSYTDDVTLAGIRQAMALKSYLVKRGISEGKLSYNMGLVNEEVPAKFSNLKGLSIVFDYDAKLPTRLLDNENKETAPLLSMAIVPPCRAIDRALGEAYAIDFSVLETVSPLDNWVLQVILHGRDGKYYVVRQLEGFSPVYHQILWNGRKGIIGPELPCGKYTVVLTGIDLKGNKQVLRRRLIVKCAETVQTTGSCQEGKCPAVVKAATTKSTVLNYKSARLWKKPGRIMRDAQTKVEQKVEQTAQQNVAAQSTATADMQAQGTATGTSDSTYTHTKTVRTIVTTDNTPAETVSSSSSSSFSSYSSGGEVSLKDVEANPYDIPYEEEYYEETVR